MNEAINVRLAKFLFAFCFFVCFALFYLRCTFLFALYFCICIVIFICVVLFCLRCAVVFALCFFICAMPFCLLCDFLAYVLRFKIYVGFLALNSFLFCLGMCLFLTLRFLVFFVCALLGHRTLMMTTLFQRG